MELSGTESKRMAIVELRVLTGTQAGTLIPVPEGKFLIGREHDCNLRPNSELISRHHCVFTLDPYSIRLRDLGSTNGTFVNGERLRGMTVLKPGDRVVAGKLEVMVVVDGHPTVTSEDTLSGQAGETLDLRRAEPVRASSDDSAIDFAMMASEVAELEDETVAVAAVPEPVASEATAATVMVEDTREMALVPPPGVDPAAMPTHNPWMGMPQQPYPFPPGAFPQYPPMPYGYGYPYPGVPQAYPPGYGYPPPAQPVDVAPEPTKPARPTGMPETRLPDPSETGAKPPEPKPVPTASDSKDPNKVHIPTAAQDIINSYLNRRPKTS